MRDLIILGTGVHAGEMASHAPTPEDALTEGTGHGRVGDEAAAEARR